MPARPMYIQNIEAMGHGNVANGILGVRHVQLLYRLKPRKKKTPIKAEDKK